MLLVQLSPDAITLATLEDILENGTPTQVLFVGESERERGREKQGGKGVCVCVCVHVDILENGMPTQVPRALPTETKVESGDVSKQKWNLC